MSQNKKITDLPRSNPELDFFFVAAKGASNYSVSYNDIARLSSIDQPSGKFTDTLTLQNNPVLTGNPDGSSPFATQADLDAIKIPEQSFSPFMFFSDFVNHVGPTYKVYYDTPNPETYLSGVFVDTLDNCSAAIRWDGPNSDYIGTGYINNAIIDESKVSELGDYTRRFEGYSDVLNLNGLDALTGSANGFTGSITLIDLPDGPTGTQFDFHDHSTVIPAPGTDRGTVDLKEGDKINLDVVYDFSEYDYQVQTPDKIFIYNEGLAKSREFDILNFWNAGANRSGVTVELEVSARNGGLGAFLHTVNVAGITGAKQNTSSAFFNESRTVDNTSPLLSIGTVNYPIGQEAIKNGESAAVNRVTTNADQIQAFSDNGELNVDTLGSVGNASTQVSYANGSYNVSNSNLRFVAKRTTNGLKATSATVVNIANAPLTLSTNLPGAIKSGPSAGASYNFILLSDQRFLQTPDLNLDNTQNPISSLSNTNNGTDENSNRYTLTVVDGEGKGLFAWNVNAVNLAGIPTTNVSNGYNIQGFTERTITADPQDLAQGIASLGVAVGNPNNITFENVSEGGPGPNGGTFYSFSNIAAGTQLDFTFDENNRFTICDSNGSTNPNGDHIFNLDSLSRAANAFVSNPAQFIVKED